MSAYQHIKIHTTKDLLCWRDVAGFALGALDGPGLVVEARRLMRGQGVGARDTALRPAMLLHLLLLQ